MTRNREGLCKYTTFFWIFQENKEFIVFFELKLLISFGKKSLALVEMVHERGGAVVDVDEVLADDGGFVVV